MEAMELNLNEMKMVTGGVTAEEVEDHIYGTVVGAGAGYVTGLTTGAAIGLVVGGAVATFTE